MLLIRRHAQVLIENIEVDYAKCRKDQKQLYDDSKGDINKDTYEKM